MNPLLTPPAPPRTEQRRIPIGSQKSFTLVELLTVMVVIALLVGLAAPLIPSLLRGNQMNSSVATLNGIMEQAREAALSQNTYVWVAFTSTNSLPANGIWVATLESQDGTESPVNANAGLPVAPSWASTLSVPGTSNLQLLTKTQNLPGVQLVDVSALSPTVTNVAAAAGIFTNSSTTLYETNAMKWTVFANQYAEGYTTKNGAASTNAGYFVKAIEFTPDGEAHTATSTWYNNIQFGLVPSTSGQTNSLYMTNAAFINVSRLTLD